MYMPQQAGGTIQILKYSIHPLMMYPNSPPILLNLNTHKSRTRFKKMSHLKKRSLKVVVRTFG